MRGSRRSTADDAVLVGAAIVLVGWLRLRLDTRLWDDTWITLNAVRHLLEGSGLHFNPALQDHALTTLAWPLLIAAAGAAGADPPTAVRVLGAASEVLLAACFGLFARRATGSLAAGLIGMTLLLCNPVVLLCSFGGMETAFTLGLMAAALGLLASDRPGAGLFAAALVPWARFDGLLFYGAMLAAVLAAGLRGRAAPRHRLFAAAPSLLLLLGYLAFTRLVYDRWLPDSVGAKLALADGTAGGLDVARELLNALLGRSSYWFRAETPYPWALPLVALGLVSLLRHGRMRRRSAPLLAFTLAYAAVLLLRGGEYATNFPWYFAPPLLAGSLLAAEGLRALGAYLPRRAVLPLGLLLAAGWVVAMDGPLRQNLAIERERQGRREVLYAATARWAGGVLEGSGERWLAGNEIGALGYFAPAPLGVIDLYGLSRARDERDLDGAQRVARHRPALVVVNRRRWREEIDALLPGRYAWRAPDTGKRRVLLLGIRNDLLSLDWRLELLERAFRQGP